MSYETIRNLLDTQLETVTGLPTLYKENTRTEPKTGVAYVRTTLLPVEPVALSTGSDEISGLYQIDLFYPVDNGTTTSEATVDAIKAAFGRGLKLTNGTVTVNVYMSWREASQTFQQFYNSPVVVRWTTIIPRS